MKSWSAIVGALILNSLSMAVLADTYPSKPIRLIIPFAAGGPTDALGRTFAKELGEVLGQTVVVENRTGAGGNIGTDVVAKSPPDGYTIGLGTNGPLAGNVTLFKSLPYDPTTAFAPITRIAFVSNVIAVHPGLGVKTLSELIELIRREPNKHNFAHGGSGTTQHLGGELFKSMAQLQMSGVAYRGEGLALNDAISGHVPIIFSSLATGIPFVQSSHLIALAVTSKDRIPALANIPTVAEAALPGYVATAWYALLAPAGTPQQIVEKLNAASRKAMESPGTKKLLDQAGAIIAPTTPGELSEFIKSEISRWKPIIEMSGAKVD